MTTKPLTSEAIALTEKKMDMSLDEIIKMSKTNNSKSIKQRTSNKGQRYNNGNPNKSLKIEQYMESRPTLRQGVLAQKRTSFKGYNIHLPAEAAAHKAAVTPFRNNKYMKWMKRPGDAFGRQGNVSNGGSALKNQQQPLPKQQQLKQQLQERKGETTFGQRPRTLDSLFANMKEQRMRAFTHRIQDRPAHTGIFNPMNDSAALAGAFTHTINDGHVRVDRATNQPRPPWLRGRIGSYRNY